MDIRLNKRPILHVCTNSVIPFGRDLNGRKLESQNLQLHESSLKKY